MDTTATHHGRLTNLARWGLVLSFGALLLPILGLIAFVVGVALLFRNEMGPGFGVIVLSPICTIIGFGLSLALMG